MSNFFNHTNADGSTCLATVVDGQKVIIGQDSEAEYYKDIEKKVKSTKPAK